MTVLVIGGTGTTGSRVARGLAQRGVPARVASRRGDGERVRFDWYDPHTHDGALAGIDAMYVVAPIGDAEPEHVMVPLLELAARSGVRRAVLLSTSAVEPGESGLGVVHARLSELFDEWTVLRPAWFMENFVGEHAHAHSIRDHGEIVTATGDGRVGFVSVDDIAAVAVAALTDPVPHNTAHLITGPQALTYADVAAITSRFTGRTVRHRAVTAVEQTERLAAAGIPRRYARFLAQLDEAIAAGAEDRTTTVVADITGRPPRSLEDVFADH
ncbi:NmrA family NAD(P)-binding protein [Nocardia brasiliensis]|uniref:NmrA family NAD(P)-binding protein n=1 Tax=Nocardia brasiliensis TaxID=37326 RepID=UPI003D8AB010